MIKLLDTHANSSILEIGTGTAWQTAMLAYLAYMGKIDTFEVGPHMYQLAKKNIANPVQEAKLLQIPIALINLHCQNVFEYLTSNKHIRFDRIISGAALPLEKTQELARFLKPNGKAILPTTSNNPLVITKQANNDISIQEIPELYLYLLNYNEY